MASGINVTFTDPHVAGYHSVVRLAAARAMGEAPPLDCALELSILAVFDVPKWSKKRRDMALRGEIGKTTRPDLENCIKGALDAMQTIVYKDDCQIVRYRDCAKVYGERPRLEITVYEMGEAL